MIPSKLLHPLQQVGDLLVGVPVVRVLHLRALPEQGVRLVEEQQDVEALRLVEDPFEVLLGLADVLVDDRRQVDPEQVEAQLGGDDVRGERLAGAGAAAEQRRDPGALAADVDQPAVREHLVAVRGPGHEPVQRARHVVGQHQVGEGRRVRGRPAPGRT